MWMYSLWSVYVTIHKALCYTALTLQPNFFDAEKGKEPHFILCPLYNYQKILCHLLEST